MIDEPGGRHPRFPESWILMKKKKKEVQETEIEGVDG